jgi:signal transduction histidine kinase
VILAVLLALGAPRATSQQLIDLADSGRVDALLTHAAYFLDPARRNDLTNSAGLPIPFETAQAWARESEGLTWRETPRVADVVLGPTWARIKLFNSGPDPQHARLDFGDALGETIEVWMVREGIDRERILLNDWFKSASQRFPQSRLVHSSQFTLLPGERAELWVDGASGLKPNGSLSLVREEAFIGASLGQQGFMALLFGFRIATFAAILAFALVLRDRIALYYSGVHAFFTAGTAVNYGYPWFYLGLTSTQNDLLVIGVSAIAFTLIGLMTREWLETRRRYPRLDWLILIGLAAGWSTLIIISLWPAQIVSVMAAVFIAAAFLVLILYGTARGALDGIPGTWLLLLGILTPLATLVINVGVNFGAAVNYITTLNITHAMYALDGVIFVSALVVRAVHIRRQRDRAQEERIAALAEKTRIAEELADAQRSYATAITLAERRRRDLAATSHDLKQPLLSLQLALRGRRGVDAISQGVSYLESVVNRVLTEARTEDREGEAAVTADREDADLMVQAVLSNVVLMFGDEAREKGLSLTAGATDARVRIEPVLLMRLLTNLVSNAVRHTHSGGIELHATQTPEGVDVSVKDSGPGMTPEEIETALRPWSKGGGSEGEGLGLSIVRDMAQGAGLGLVIRSSPGEGSTFIIAGIPAVAAPAIG